MGRVDSETAPEFVQQTKYLVTEIPMSNEATTTLAKELHGGMLDGITAQHQLHKIAIPSRGFMVSVPWLSVAWKGKPSLAAIRRWVDLHATDLGAYESPWQITDVPSLKTDLPLYAGAWHDSGITWIDANIVISASDPARVVSGDLLEHTRSARAGDSASYRFCPERGYSIAAEVAQFAGRAWGQVEIWDIEKNVALPSDHSW
jgi:hypothetical protein